MHRLNRNIKELLESSKTIAVVGLSDSPKRTSYQVTRVMQARGYRIIPVNPNCSEILGEKCYPSLLDVPGQIDIVNVFRRPEFVPEIVAQAVKIKAKAVWMQLGVIHETAARTALEAGLQVVMDHCIKVEHSIYF